MILHKLTFGTVTPETREDAEDIAENYVAVLLHNGQACGEYFTVVHHAALCYYVSLQGIHALETKHHCKYGIERLNKVVADDTSDKFWNFPFRCEPCRLVSHLANDADDERHAVIGKWRGN